MRHAILAALLCCANLPGQQTSITLFPSFPTAIDLASSQNPSIYGQSLTLTATVGPSTVTGTVTFYDGTGDGTAKVGIYRPSTGTWFLDANNNGVFDAGDLQYQFGGLPGDIAFAGD